MQAETRAVDVDLNSVVVLGQHIARSAMCGVENEYQGTLVAFECYKRNMTPIEFSRVYHIMHGKPSMRADAMLAEFVREGHNYEIVEIGPGKVHVKGGPKGGKVRDWILTIEDAERKELPFQPKKGGGYLQDANGKPIYKDNWRKQPENMLFARVVSDMIRKTAPHIVAGIYTPEEVSDFDEQPRASAPRAVSVSAPAPVAPTLQPEPQPAPVEQVTPAAPATPKAEPTNADPAILLMPAELPKVGGLPVAELSDAQKAYFAERGASFPWWNETYAAAFAKAVEA